MDEVYVDPPRWYAYHLALSVYEMVRLPSYVEDILDGKLSILRWAYEMVRLQYGMLTILRGEYEMVRLQYGKLTILRWAYEMIGTTRVIGTLHLQRDATRFMILFRMARIPTRDQLLGRDLL